MKERLGHAGSGEPMAQRDEVTKLGEQVYYNQDAVEVVGQRQLFDEVHGNYLPSRILNEQIL